MGGFSVKEESVMRFANLIILFCILSIGIFSRADGQPIDSRYSRTPTLFVPHAAIDHSTGDLLIISNSWRNHWHNLRRFSSEGVPDESFILQRFESCCAIRPSLVAVDSEGFIYTLEHSGELGGFFIYKHHASGDLDIDWGNYRDNTQNYAGADDGVENSGWWSGETSLEWIAGGGRVQFSFFDPVDMIPRKDGSLLVLDRAARYVYLSLIHI